MTVCGKRNVSIPGYFLLLLIFGLAFASYYWTISPTQEELGGSSGKPEPPRCLQRSQVTNGTITQLENRCSFIIAAYLDNRSNPSVRMISIVHRAKVRDLYCLFCCHNSQTIPVKGDWDFHADHFGFPYVTADLICLEPQDCYPQHLSLHTSPKPNLPHLPVFRIRNWSSGDPSVEFTVCISTMFGGYNNVLQFVQSVEMYKILGAQRVVIYKNNCSLLMEKVLGHYVSEGIVKVVPWPIDLYLSVSTYWHHSMDPKDIGYYGQTAALNDCVYRNMYRSKYVLLIDADEIILPVKDADWKSLMQRLQEENPNVGVFLFENHIFRNTVFAPSTPFNFSSWDPVPGVNIFQHIYKEPNKQGSFNNKKMVVDPRKVVQTSVHSVLKLHGEAMQVPSDVAINFHCRIPEWKELPEESLIRDPILWRYNLTLIKNVNRVLRKSGILEATAKV